MRPGYVLLLAVAVMVLLVLAGRQFWLAWEQRREQVRRSALSLAEARSSTLRYRADQWLRRTSVGAAVERELTTAGLEWSVLSSLLGLVAAAVGAFVVVRSIAPWWLAVGAVYGVWRGVQGFLESRRGRRLDAFVAQLPEIARTISNAAAAGQSLQAAVRLAGDELEAPGGTELQLVAEQLRIGQSLDGALAELRRRMPSREVGVLVTTLLIQRAAGGDVVRALREMAETLEKRKELRSEVRTLMAGAVFTGYAVVGLGVVAVLLVNASQPGALDIVLSSWPGRLAALVSVGLYAVGIALIRAQQAVDV